LLTSCNFSSLVIDKLCDEAVGRDTAVTCFYFDYAARREQSPIKMVGSLLRQLVKSFGRIPDLVSQEFHNQQNLIGGRRLNISRIVTLFQVLAATMRTFICVDALDECAPEHRVVVLDSLRDILRGSPNTRIFMTGRCHVRCEIEGRLGEGAIFIAIEPREDDVLKYLHRRLEDDTTPRIMNSQLRAEILRSIPEMSSET